MQENANESVHEVMTIAVSETEFAFRVNGVTVAKRHLAATIGRSDDSVTEKTLARYLVIVPFLATAFRMPKEASESVRYGAIKAKSLFKALRITEDNTMAFMMVFLRLAETDADSPQEAISAVSQRMRDGGFYTGKSGSFPTGERQSPRKTLH